MPKEFIPLDQIEEMTTEERSFLSEQCFIKLGYHDPKNKIFVVMREENG
ncbi:hypothetical protein KKC45_00545 [Patescibacteria group bacterium]|nr:hypothetical protein [Patescibacteria group bacterium]